MIPVFDPYVNALQTLIVALGFNPDHIPLDGGIAVDEDGYLVVTELVQPPLVERVDGELRMATRAPRRFRVTVEEVA